MSYPDITNTTTWISIQVDPRITDIQHPIYNHIYTKTEFEEEFKQLLNNLNGDPEKEPKNFFGFYVEVNPLNCCALVFKDQQTKSKFTDMAIKLKLIPALKEIHQGETELEYQQRPHQCVLPICSEEEFHNLPMISDSEDSSDEGEEEEDNPICEASSSYSMSSPASSLSASLPNRSILHLKRGVISEEEPLDSIQNQKKKKEIRDRTISQFYKDYLVLINIYEGCLKKKSDIISLENCLEKKNILRTKLQAGKQKLDLLYQQFNVNYPEKEKYPEFSLKLQSKLIKIPDFLNQ